MSATTPGFDALLTALDAAARGEVRPEHLPALRAWDGWGPMASDLRRYPLTERGAHLAQLGHDALEQARTIVDTSFFTPDWLVSYLWSVARRAGFEGGTVIEPGCGSGRILTGRPADCPGATIGVELDTLSAAVAAALNPQSTIMTTSFMDADLPAADLVIGNVPFGDSKVWDRADRALVSIHHGFVNRAVRSLRPGGLLVLVVSRYLMDGYDAADVLAPVDLLGAVRLPAGVFAGTDAIADVVVARKRPALLGVDRDQYQTLCTMDEVPSAHEGVSTRVSGYWAQHPNLVCGVMEGGTHHARSLLINAPDPGAAILAAFTALAAELTANTDRPVPAATGLEVEGDGGDDQSVPAHLNGTFRLGGDGDVSQARDGAWVPVSASKELVALLRLRDAGGQLLAAEADLGYPDDERERARTEAHRLYRAYRDQYGPLNRGTLHEGTPDPDTGAPAMSWRRPRLGGFRDDPQYLSVMALEVFDQDTGIAEPAPILLRRVNHPPTPVQRVDTIAEAVTVSMGELGKVCPDRVAALLGTTRSKVEDHHLPLVAFKDPAAGGRWIRAEQYLSGDVLSKLVTAETAAAADPQYQRNVTALREIAPPPLGPNEIQIRLGSPIVTAEDIAAFLKEHLGLPWAHVSREPLTAAWEVAAPVGASVTNSTYGTTRLSAGQLVSIALNGKAPVVYDTITDPVTGNERRVRNADQTLAAQDKVNLLNTEFGVWVWSDPDRAHRVAAEYNRRFNAVVPRTHDGSWLMLPGLSRTLTPHPHQLNFTDRALCTPAVLCGHAVGAGKTLTMAFIARALRHYGLANKPALVVPNHLLEQISRELQQAFPTGRYLVAGTADLAKDKRRLFLARCATGDWDAVVLTHSAFTSIPVRPQLEIDWIEGEIARYRDAQYATTEQFAVKELARRERTLRSRLERARDNQRTDPAAVYFEDLGIDYLAIDESHLCKRLEIASRAEGFGTAGSKRAADLLLKSQWLAARRPGSPHLCLLTGTPYTNTLAEAFTWSRFLQPEALVAAGVDQFDAWAATFVVRETVVEVAPDGSGFRTATRPTRITNVPDLLRMMSPVVEILGADQLGLQRPEAVTREVVVDMTPQQAQFVAGLIERAEKLRTGRRGGSGDNMLAIVGEGRRVALDPHLVGVDDPGNKIAAVAANVAAIWSAHRHTLYGRSPKPGALQIVFCDQGTPGPKGAQSYGRLKAALVDAGMDPARVRFVHEAKDDKAKAALFAACRDGEVDVLVASTDKAGVGTNCQRRCVAIHHMDAPWRPSDLEQRDGRALRPGNLNGTVQIVRYVVQRSLDAFSWQTLERKAIGFAVLLRPDMGVREVEDIGEVAPDLTHMKALASGNPLLLQQAQIAATVHRLRVAESVERQQVVTLNRRAGWLRNELAGAEQYRARLVQARDDVAAAGRDPETLAAVAVSAMGKRLGMRGQVAGSLTVHPDSRGVQVRVGPFTVLAVCHRSRPGEVREWLATWLGSLLDGSLLQDRDRLEQSWLQELADAERYVNSYRFSRHQELFDAQSQLDAVAAQLSELAA